MDKIEKLINEAQEESLLVKTSYNYKDKNGQQDTNWIMVNKAVDTLKEIKQIVKENKTDLLANYNSKKEKYLKEIIELGKCIDNENGISLWDMKCNVVMTIEYHNFAVSYKYLKRKELYKLACDNKIASRSHMNKNELIKALMKI